MDFNYQPAIISFNPSIICSISSGVALLIFAPSRLMDKVRIWLILTHDLLGNFFEDNSIVSGKSAFGSWLVRAITMTVPECSLKVL
jgi:hypothetical protein